MLVLIYGGGFMKIYKAYKFRLYPNIDQQELINKTLGCARFVYNTMLYEKKHCIKKINLQKQKMSV